MLDENDRERLNALRAYEAKFDDNGNVKIPNMGDNETLVDMGVEISLAECRCYSISGRHQWARQEIARLEAMDTTPTVAPDPGWVNASDWVKLRSMDLESLRMADIKYGSDGVLYLNVPYVSQPGDSIVVEVGGTDDAPITESWTIKRDDPPCRFTNDTPDGEYRAEHSLDDFMREREAMQSEQARKAYVAEALARSDDMHDTYEIGHQSEPASRELVERMVRQATSHSLWPVKLEWCNDDTILIAWAVMPHAPAPRSHHAIAEVDDFMLGSMEDLLSALARSKAMTYEWNATACPACNGQGKTRGYFFGEKQCPDCEGTGVR